MSIVVFLKEEVWLEVAVNQFDTYSLSSLQTEEDYIPYPSVHEVHVSYYKYLAASTNYAF